MAYSFVIEPPPLFIEFDNEAEQLEKCKEWGLLSEKATKTKTFYYKGNGMNEPCRIIGYVDRMTAVIEFDNKRQHCIHPSYLKEMQASTYGQRYGSRADAEEEAAAPEEAGVAAAVLADKEIPAAAIVPDEKPAAAAPEPEEAKPEAEPEPKAAEPAKAKAAKGKSKKIELPEEKVKMTATVKEFTTVPNHFSDTDDEVVIYEAVTILEPEPIELGDAWSSYSATLKKLELDVGDAIAFEAKVIAKKLTKHPVPYKINNPSKLQKTEA